MRPRVFCLVLLLSAVLSAGSAAHAQDLGRTVADSLHRVLAETTEQTERIDVLNALAYALYTEAPDSTRLYAAEARALAEETAYEEGVARALTVQAIGLYAAGDREEALTLFETARSKWTALEKLEEAAGVGANIGILLMQKGAYAQALEANLESARVYGSVDGARQLVSVYNNIGIIYGRQNDYAEALRYYELALDKAQQVDSAGLIAMVRANIGGVLSDKGAHGDALDHYGHALQIYEETGVTAHRIRVQGSIGDVHLERGDYTAGQEAYENALALAESADHPAASFILRGLGLAHLRQGNTAMASRYLTRAEAATSVADDPSEQEALDKAFYELHKAQGQYAQALDRFEAHVALRDSIFSETQAERLADLRTRYDMEQQALENDILRAREAEQEATIARQRLFVIFGVLFVLVLGGMSLLLYRTNRRLHRAVEKLGEKTDLIQEQRDELVALNASKDELFAVIGHDLRGPVGNIKMLLDTLLDESATLDKATKRDVLEMADETAAASVTLLENLLFWAQSQQGNLKATAEPVPARQLIHRNMKLLRAEARNKNIHLATVLEDAVVLHVDEKMAGIVVRNLLANAIKFTPREGHISVRTSVEHEQAVITIADTGVGMSAELRALLAEGESTSSDGTAGEQGTGLGLKLCHALLERTGGHWTIESAQGKGTTVRVYWPLAKRSVPDEAPAAHAQAA